MYELSATRVSMQKYQGSLQHGFTLSENFDRNDAMEIITTDFRQRVASNFDLLPLEGMHTCAIVGTDRSLRVTKDHRRDVQ